MEDLFCILLCGIPGVGKTTKVRTTCQSFETRGYVICHWSELRQLPYTGNEKTIAVINFDEIREKYVRLFKSSEEYVYRKILDEFWYCFQYCKEKRINAIIDSTNIKRSQRVNKLKVFNSFKKICWCLTEDFDEIVRRNATRDRVVPIDHLREYYQTFEMPTYDEPFDEIWVNDELISKPDCMETDDEEL